MDKPIEPVTEIDIMAYADGLLDSDMARKRTVEAHIAQDPRLSRWVEDIRAQNTAIRERFAAVLADPTPPRLASVLQRDFRPSKTWPRVAVLASLLIISSVIGWFIGSKTALEETASDRFIERAAREHKTSAAAVLERSADTEETSLQDLTTLSRQISFHMAAPDLHKFGYTLVDKKQVDGPEYPIVRLVYRNTDKSHISLLLRPRWAEDTTVTRSFDEDGVTIQYWLDGPIELALVTDDTDITGGQLAGAIHDAISQARLRDLAANEVKAGSIVNLDSNVRESARLRNRPATNMGQSQRDSIQTY